MMANCAGLGIHDNKTLLGELYEKSGSMVKPFIDEAIERLFKPLPFNVDQIETVLLPIDEEDVAIQLYRGCVWELTAIAAACIVCIATENTTEVKRAPLSSYEPVERAQFILQQY
jgi:hypothetical protein